MKSPETMIETIELDILGQVCPACLLVVLRQINQYRERLRDGTTRLLVRTDHRDTTRTVPASAQKMGLGVEVRKVKTWYEISIGGKS